MQISKSLTKWGKEALINDIIEDQEFKIKSEAHYMALKDMLGAQNMKGLVYFLIDRNKERVAGRK